MLLALEGVTVVHMAGLVSAHMFIGMVLIPPVALKLGSTGYRFLRYYAGARTYRALGPPRALLRVLAPALVASTLAVFATGVLLLATRHKAGGLLEIHKVSFIVFGLLFVVHFLAYITQVARSLHRDWRRAQREAVPGAGGRATLVALAVGGGAVLAFALLHAINNWRA